MSRPVVDHVDAIDVLDVTAELPLTRLPREASGVGLLMRANALNKLGYDAAPTAREEEELGLGLPGIRAISMASKWQAGEVDGGPLSILRPPTWSLVCWS